MTRQATPLIPHGGNWGSQGTVPGFIGNVLTQPFARGITHTPGDSIAVLGMFYLEFFPRGSVVASDIVATYGGLPCQVAASDSNVTPSTSDSRLVVAVLCTPAVTDAFSGSDFVLTVGSAPSFLQSYGFIGSITLDVDPALDLSTALAFNGSQTLDPAQWTMSLPPVNGGALGMLVTLATINEGGFPVGLEVLSPAGWTSAPFAFGGNIPYGYGYRQTPIVESDSIVWGLNGAATIHYPDGNSLTFDFPGAPDVPCDPDFPDVVLLLALDGADGSTVVVDSSAFAHAMTVHGAAAQSDVQQFFGVGSLHLPSTSTSSESYVAVPIVAAGPLDILSDASGDFTIEGWFWLDTTNTADLIIFDYGDDLTTFAGVSSILLFASSVFGGFLEVQPTIPSWSAVGGATGLTLQTWHHFAVTRAGAVGRLFLDGVQQGGIASNWNGYAGPPVGSSATFGWSATISGGLCPGYLDEIRVTKGIARYTSNFTPPAQPFGGSCTITVPNVIGLTQAAATTVITGALLTLGIVSTGYSISVPAGLVFQQSPSPGDVVAAFDPVNITLSLGPQFAVVPNVVGLSAGVAKSLITAAGLISGTVFGVVDPTTPIGDVSVQSPIAGLHVAFGSAVNLGISFLVTEFDIDATVISQYANSPTILALVEDFGQWFDPAANIQDFYLTVWNIDTAVGFGLDIWGIILGVSRVVPIPGTSGSFGFDNADVPADWENFGNRDNPNAGGPFFSGQISTGSYRLDDGPYLTLLLTKALANVCATTAPALNALISNLFPGRGRCYTVDLGDMQMAYHFNFALTSIELAILEFSGVLAHPAGVGVSIQVVPESLFGFKEAGTLAKPFNFGVFYNGN